VPLLVALARLQLQAREGKARRSKEHGALSSAAVQAPAHTAILPPPCKGGNSASSSGTHGLDREVEVGVCVASGTTLEDGGRNVAAVRPRTERLDGAGRVGMARAHRKAVLAATGGRTKAGKGDIRDGSLVLRARELETGKVRRRVLVEPRTHHAGVRRGRAARHRVLKDAPKGFRAARPVEDGVRVRVEKRPIQRALRDVGWS